MTTDDAHQFATSSYHRAPIQGPLRKVDGSDGFWTAGQERDGPPAASQKGPINQPRSKVQRRLNGPATLDATYLGGILIPQVDATTPFYPSPFPPSPGNYGTEWSDN